MTTHAARASSAPPRAVSRGERPDSDSDSYGPLRAGLLAIPLALKGADVSASDISAAMVGETERRYNAVIAEGATAPKSAPKFEAMDLESASGSYDLVTCLDVMIHYPQVRTPQPEPCAIALCTQHAGTAPKGCALPPRPGLDLCQRSRDHTHCTLICKCWQPQEHTHTTAHRCTGRRIGQGGELLHGSATVLLVISVCPSSRHCAVCCQWKRCQSCQSWTASESARKQ